MLDVTQRALIRYYCHLLSGLIRVTTRYRYVLVMQNTAKRLSTLGEELLICEVILFNDDLKSLTAEVQVGRGSFPACVMIELAYFHVTHSRIIWFDPSLSHLVFYSQAISVAQQALPLGRV